MLTVLFDALIAGIADADEGLPGDIEPKVIVSSCDIVTSFSHQVTTTMPSIPIDVLQMILEHVGKNDLPTLCRVNKIFCSCSRDVLYREIYEEDADAIATLAQSTDIAKRVRSFYNFGRCPELATALRNMSSLCRLELEG